jgi:DNA-binding NarL/FixJ family response regulator
MTCAPSEFVARGNVGMLTGVPDIASLGWAVSREGEVGTQFCDQILALAPDVVVLAGIGADSRWLLDRVGALVAAEPTARILTVVWLARPGWISDLAQAGASGIADLDVSADQLRGAVRALASGQDWVSPGVAAQLGREQREREAGREIQTLSQREWDVLNELVHGRDNAGIAAALGISAHTVAGHLQAICAKLHATSRLHAAVIAIRMGLVGI